MENFNNLRSYRQHFKELVELERQEEINRHMNEIKRLSPQKRQAAGRSILNARSRDAGRGLGGTYLVKYVRHDGLPDTEIAVGDLVIASSGHPNGEEPQATVIEKSNYSLTVAFSNKPPGFVYKKRVRVDLFANDITFQRMLNALQSLNKDDTLTQLLLGKLPIHQTSPEAAPEFANETLNTSQQEAVKESLKADHFFLMHGPPGTGKTTTITESIIQHIQQGDKVLATADSNVATDNLVEALARQDVSVIRVGNPARITPALMEHALAYKIESTERYQQSQSCWDKINELQDKQDPYPVPSGKNRRGLRDKQIQRLAKQNKSSRGLSPKKIKGMAKWLQLQKKINELAEEALDLEQKAVNQLLDEASVICTTNASAGNDTMNEYMNQLHGGFDTIFIDEATQSVEPACLIPMVKGQKFIMAGDHKQLPPTVLHQKAEKELQHTLFERLIKIYGEPAKHLLKIQYRMHKAIMKFPNQQFYNNLIEAHSSVAEHTLDELGLDDSPLKEAAPWTQESLQSTPPSVFIDTTPLTKAQERQRKKSHSYENPAEGKRIEELARHLIEAGISPPQIGIISPYDDQVDRLQSQLKDIEQLEIKTVDGFQGREKEVIMISFVRANRTNNIGFLTDLRRLNVAITRARRKLIMIGHAATLNNHPTYKNLIDQTPHVTL